MPDSWLIALAGLLLLTRFGSLRRFWQLPHKQGAGWLFTTEVSREFAQGAGARLVRAYRRWLLVPFALDALVIAWLMFKGWAFYLPHEQLLSVILTAVFYNLLVAHFAYRVKAMIAPAQVPPVTAAQLTMEPRRLRDHTHWLVEAALLGLTVAAVALLERLHTALLWSGYFQLGLLLLKLVFVRWRMKLPLQRTEEYQRWRIAWLTYHLRVFDAVRVAVALMTLYFALHQSAWLRGGAVLALATLLPLFVYCAREHRRLMRVADEVQPITLARELPPAPVAEGRFFAGGLLYFNRDNPVALARSPGGIALNLAHRSIYLWALYLTGLVLLTVWQIKH